MSKPYIIAWLIKFKGKIHRMAAKMLTYNRCSWLPNNDRSQLLRNWTTLCHTITSACASYWKGGSAASTTSAAVGIPHTREASSSLPKEHRLRCHRASGITGGGWDRDNSEEWNRVGHPWPKENGNDVEAAAWLTLDSTFFKREQRISEKHRAPHVFSFLVLHQFHSHPPLLQQPTLLDLSRMWPHLMMTA